MMYVTGVYTGFLLAFWEKQSGLIGIFYIDKISNLGIFYRQNGPNWDIFYQQILTHQAFFLSILGGKSYKL